MFKEVLYGSLYNEGSLFRFEYVNKIIYKCIKWLLILLFINLYGFGVFVVYYYICVNKCDLDLWLFKISICIKVLMYMRVFKW